MSKGLKERRKKAGRQEGMGRRENAEKMVNQVRDRDGLTEEDLTGMLRFANTAAYLVTTRKGAIRSMPERADVMALLQ